METIKTIDATGAFVRQPYRHICKSHQTLLMLRRSEANRDKCKSWKKVVDPSKPPAEKAPNLELRHQRTGDVVFDFVEADSRKKPMYFIYKLIETLLPKAMNKYDSTRP